MSDGPVRVSADRELCIQAGNCVMVAGDVFDQDDDGRPDIYVANDSMPNLMWRNQGDGTFADVADRLGIARSHEGLDQAGMGVAVGDGNGDARLDLYVTNFSEDYFTLYEADGKGFFRDRTRRAGLANPTMSSLGWSAGFHDLDLDGDVALFGHGHCLRVLTARWLGLPPTDGQMFLLDTATVSVLGFEHDYHVIRKWNQASDLVEVKEP